MRGEDRDPGVGAGVGDERDEGTEFVVEGREFGCQYEQPVGRAGVAALVDSVRVAIELGERRACRESFEVSLA